MLPDASDKPEMVDHPAHYQCPGDTTGQYEAIRIIEAMGMGREFCIGNAMKYLLRAGKKPVTSEREDLLKCVWYLRRRISQLEREQD